MNLNAEYNNGNIMKRIQLSCIKWHFWLRYSGYHGISVQGNNSDSISHPSF